MKSHLNKTTKILIEIISKINSEDLYVFFLIFENFVLNILVKIKYLSISSFGYSYNG